jgi:hypothetical protein
VTSSATREALRGAAVLKDLCAEPLPLPVAHDVCAFHGQRGGRAEVRKMKLLMFLVLGVALVAGLWPSQTAAAEHAGTYRGEAGIAVTYYAGGVGQSAQEDTAERSPDYSVRVLFATPERTLLGNVALTVTDMQGRVVFRIEKADPIIYLGLPGGTYAFEGGYHGATKRFLRVAVDPPRRRDVLFVFPE